MSAPMESTYQGYISSTHDALLIFECVRRGVMPKVKRRLREDERRLIRSGQVFVFDEKESGIKRWTDGLLWSPSRILWNFLVYRQVDKKAGGRSLGSAGQGSLDGSPKTMEAGPFGADQQHPLQAISAPLGDPFALGVDTSFGSEAVMASMPQSAKSDSPQQVAHASSSSAFDGPSRIRSASSASDSFAVWQANGMVTNEAADFGSLPSQSQMEDERNLVGSLRSSYPFAKGGLCKKTISIQMDGTTQHLISYYTVEDVRSGRLRTPSSLPEVASLSISPIFLRKTLFRFPPAVFMGPDGVPRFRAEDNSKGEVSAESSGEGTSSGSDSRPHVSCPAGLSKQTARSSDPARIKTSSLGSAVLMPKSAATSPVAASRPSSSSTLVDLRQTPMAHQIGGTGFYQPSRRASDAALRTSRSRFEPYPSTSTAMAVPGPSSFKSGGESSVSTSPNSLPATPFFQSTAGVVHGYEVGSADQMQRQPVTSPMGYGLPPSQQQSLGQDARARSAGIPTGEEAGLYRDNEETRERLLEEMIAEQQQYDMQQQASGSGQQIHDQWGASVSQQPSQSRQRALFASPPVEVDWTAPSEAAMMFRWPGPAGGSNVDDHRQHTSAPIKYEHQYAQQQPPPQQHDPSHAHPQSYQATGSVTPQRNLWQEELPGVSLHGNQPPFYHQVPPHQQQQYQQFHQHAPPSSQSSFSMPLSNDAAQDRHSIQQPIQTGDPWTSNAMPPPPSSFILNAPPRPNTMPQGAGHLAQNRMAAAAAAATTTPFAVPYWAPERASSSHGHLANQLPHRSKPSDEELESLFLHRPSG